jgi:AcrR family transcriptional regulator
MRPGSILDSPVTAGRRERRKAATRTELIRAGQKLFGERGLYEPRIEDLTTSAGIAKGTLYTYFADKDELVRAVAASGFAQLEQHVARRAKRARTDAGVIRELVAAHLEFFAKHPDLMRVFHQVRGMLKFDRAEWRPLRSTINDYLTGLARVLDRAPRMRRLSSARRLELARLLFGAVSGVSSVATVSESRASRRGKEEVLVKCLVAAAIEFLGLPPRASGHGVGRSPA